MRKICPKETNKGRIKANVFKGQRVEHHIIQSSQWIRDDEDYQTASLHS